MKQSFTTHKALLRTIVTIAVGMILGYSNRRVGAQTTRNPETSEMRAFASREEHIHYAFAHGGQESHQQSVFARKPDGSSVRKREVASPHGESGLMVELTDFEERKIVTVEPFTKSKITSFYDDKELSRQLTTSAANCASLGFESDVMAKKEVDNQGNVPPNLRKIFEGKIFPWSSTVNDSKVNLWLSREIDCYPLLERVDYPSGAHFVARVTSISFDRGDVDRAFEVSDEYEERSPREVESLYSQMYPGHLLYGENLLAVIEPRYQAHKFRK